MKPEGRPAHQAKSIETKKSPEMFRASLGFDFIFSRDAEGTLHCYCIEINGHDSGVSGVAAIPRGQMNKTRQVMASVRANHSNEVGRRVGIANEIREAVQKGDFTPSPEGLEVIQKYVKASLDKYPMFEHAYENPASIENITRDKRVQHIFIPKENCPRVWHPGDDPISKSGFWVVKYYNSRAGKDVHVLDNVEFAHFLQIGEEKDLYAVQEFIRSSGAENAPESMKENPVSMRLLMDFRYLEDGTIETDFATAYQRVAPTHPQDWALKGLEGGMTERYVVNRSKGAMSVAVSAGELALAEQCAVQIINKLAEGYLMKDKSA